MSLRLGTFRADSLTTEFLNVIEDEHSFEPGAREVRCYSLSVAAVMMDRQTMSIREACELARISRWTIHSWIRSNEVEYVRTAGGQVRVYADSLWMRCITAAEDVDPGPSAVIS